MKSLLQWYKDRSWQAQYGLAIGVTLLCLLVRWLLMPIVGLAAPFLLFVPAVSFSAWYGGVVPGLIATGLSCLLIDYFLLEPLYSIGQLGLRDLILLGLFMVIGIKISLLLGRLVTAQRQTERLVRRTASTLHSLEKSEERYRQLIEGVKDYAIFALDLEGRVISWNAGAERLQGYQSREVLGQSFSRFYSLEDQQQNKPHQDLEQAMAEGRCESMGWRMRKDQSLFWADTVITVLRDDHGRLQGFSKVIRDISAQKQIEEQVRRSLKELSDMKDALDQSAIVVTTDRRGRIQYVNDKFCEISKYSREELMGQDHRLLNSGYHSKSFFQNLWSTITQGRIWKGEIKNQAKDGSYYWVDTTIVPFLDEQGFPFQYLAIRFDITKLKQAESGLQQLNSNLESQVGERTAQLSQSLSFEAALKRITDKVRDSLDERQILQTAVHELGEGLGVTCCNAALYDLDHHLSVICYEYNTTIFPVKGRRIDMQKYPDLYQPLLQGQYLQFCNLIVNPIRGRVTMLACPIFDDQGVLGDLWLITDKEYAFRELELRLVQQVANHCAIALRQARLFQEVQAQVKTLERLNWLKDDFLSTVSHELRTPVSNMKMSIRMLEVALGQADLSDGSRQKVTQYLQILSNECEREISLVNDLLDLQRLEAGKRALALETIQVQLWLSQVAQPFQERMRARQQDLYLDLPTQEFPPLVSDVAALERILAELLNNACKYTPPGERIVVKAEMQPGMMQLSVTNFGVEIPDSELYRIFDKFYRVPNADPWKQGGTGLGLALVQRLTEHLGGTVQVSSGCGQTTFVLEIPNQGVYARTGAIANNLED